MRWRRVELLTNVDSHRETLDKEIREPAQEKKDSSELTKKKPKVENEDNVVDEKRREGEGRDINIEAFSLGLLSVRQISSRGSFLMSNHMSIWNI